MKSAQFAVCCSVVLGIFIFTGSHARSSQSITPARAATVEQNVRQLMQSVARDISQEGPLAWRKYFEVGPSFFMAVNGQMAFADGTAASEGTQSFSRTIQHIELQWGDLRVDPLTSEFRDGRWQFRSAHWSSPAAPSPSH